MLRPLAYADQWLVSSTLRRAKLKQALPSLVSSFPERTSIPLSLSLPLYITWAHPPILKRGPLKYKSERLPLVRWGTAKLKQALPNPPLKVPPIFSKIARPNFYLALPSPLSLSEEREEG